MSSEDICDQQTDETSPKHEIGKHVEGCDKKTRPQRISVIPPYWQWDLQNDFPVDSDYVQERRNDSSIILEDHTQKSEHCKALWAKSVSIDDYTVISGATMSIGDYVVWNCTVETLSVWYHPSGWAFAAMLIDSREGVLNWGNGRFINIAREILFWRRSDTPK